MRLKSRQPVYGSFPSIAHSLNLQNLKQSVVGSSSSRSSGSRSRARAKATCEKKAGLQLGIQGLQNDVKNMCETQLPTRGVYTHRALTRQNNAKVKSLLGAREFHRRVLPARAGIKWRNLDCSWQSAPFELDDFRPPGLKHPPASAIHRTAPSTAS